MRVQVQVWGKLSTPTSKRTASGHTATFQFKQSPNGAALRWRARLALSSACSRSKHSSNRLKRPHFPDHPFAEFILGHIHIVPTLQIQPVPGALSEIAPQA